MITSLRMAITCALLAPAGPQRSRMLGTLYKDERSHALPNFSMLEKMYMERLLCRSEVHTFAASLATHQKATLEDGVTVLDRAVTEHNMLATSNLYANITFEQLGQLLGIDATKAESVAASMLAEERLNGYIDQLDCRIHFEQSVKGDDGGEATPEATDSLLAFDAQINRVCRSVETIASAIIAKHDTFVAVDPL